MILNRRLRLNSALDQRSWSRRTFVVFVIWLFAAAPQLGRGQEAPAEKQKQEESLVYEREGDWKPLFRGVDGLNLKASSPRVMKGYAVRIAFETPGIEFVSTPDNGDRPQEVDSARTSTFLKQQKCQLAINAGAFGPVSDFEGASQDIQGLHIHNGRLVSPWQMHRDAVVIDKKNAARIIRESPDDLSDIQTAVSGFQVLLWEGEVLRGGDDLHPRTALGLSEDGKTMYWLVIDGRQPGYSEGAKTRETAQILKDLGAYNGINLDGGGSSTLAIEEKEGRVKLINRPVHRGIPGLERPSASHLGVRAERLP